MNYIFRSWKAWAILTSTPDKPPPASPRNLDNPSKSILTMFQMILSKKIKFLFLVQKNFGLSRFKKKKIIFYFLPNFFVYFWFYNECEPNPLPPASSSNATA